MKDFPDDDDTNTYLEHFRREVIPEIRRATINLTVYSGKVDPKLCLELGASILLDKPLLVVAVKGSHLPPKLRLLADRVVEVEDVDAPGASEEIKRAVWGLLGGEKVV